MQQSTRNRLASFRAEGGPFEVWLDVDGVMTRQKDLVIYDVLNEGGLVGFEERDGNGIRLARSILCDDRGNPIPHKVHYLAGVVGRPVLEGYHFDTRDGQTIISALRAGVRVCFISGRNSPSVLGRAQALGAEHFLGARDKVPVIEQHRCVPWERIFFIGDGFQDIGTLERVGVPVCPADADPRIRDAIPDVWRTVTEGGEGVVYEALGTFLEYVGIRLS